MTITELIDHLKKLRAEHGECWVENDRGVTFVREEIRWVEAETILIEQDD